MFIVTETNTPSYLPEPLETCCETFEDAFGCAIELETRLENMGYRIVGPKRRSIPRDADGITWTYERVHGADTLHRYISIERLGD